ncbi:MAG: hypothetical protein ACOH2I_08980 [Pseudomonas sp.]
MTFKVFLFAILGLNLGGCTAYAGDRYGAPDRWEQSEYRHEQNRRYDSYRGDDRRGFIIYQPRYQPQRYERRHAQRYDSRYYGRDELRANRHHDRHDRHDGHRDSRSRERAYYGRPQQRDYRQHGRSQQNGSTRLRLYSR